MRLSLIMILLSLEYIKYWVAFGALSGGIISGIDKVVEIGYEKNEKLNNPLFERPIRAVYQTSRIAGAAGFGSFIGGVTALTAPVSIPGYIYWKSNQTDEPKEKES